MEFADAVRVRAPLVGGVLVLARIGAALSASRRLGLGQAHPTSVLKAVLVPRAASD